VDASLAVAMDAFDFEFTGETTSTVWKIKDKLLAHGQLAQYKLGVIVGPSGSGKSTCLSQLSCNAARESISWDSMLPVISQISGSLPRAQELCKAVALSSMAAQRAFHELSDGEQHLAELAKRLGDADGRGTDDAVPLDEFTSTLDRALARRVCSSISEFIRQSCKLRIIVATVHDDVAAWLDADWVLQAKTGSLSVPLRSMQHGTACEGTGTRTLRSHLSQTDGSDEQQVKELLRPPVLRLAVRHLSTNESSKRVFHEAFEEHHYMQGKLPGMFSGVVARDEESGRLVAFHAISLFPASGNGGITMLESRLVTLPEFQGFRVGPEMSEGIGELLLSAGKRLFSVTHHPRLGGLRNASKLWRGTKFNGKAQNGLNGAKTGRKAYRHQYMGKDGHGNDEAAKAASAKSVGLLSRPGVLIRTAGSKKPLPKALARLADMEGKTVQKVLDDAGKADALKVRRQIEYYIKKGWLDLSETRQEEHVVSTPQKRTALVLNGSSLGSGGEKTNETNNKKVRDFTIAFTHCHGLKRRADRVKLKVTKVQ